MENPKYKAWSYYGSNYSGLEADFESNDWSEIEDFCHDMLMNGGYCEIKNNESGKSLRIDPDEYIDSFDGEFIYKASDLEECVKNKDENKKAGVKTHKPVLESAHKIAKEVCNFYSSYAPNNAKEHTLNSVFTDIKNNNTNNILSDMSTILESIKLDPNPEHPYNSEMKKVVENIIGDIKSCSKNISLVEDSQREIDVEPDKYIDDLISDGFKLKSEKSDDLVFLIKNEFPDKSSYTLVVVARKTNKAFIEVVPYEDDEEEDINKRFELVDRKSVQDSDGFYTDYSWYYDNEEKLHVFVLGDSDLYDPENGYDEWDWECESDQEAREWFDSYNGFADDLEESIKKEAVGDKVIKRYSDVYGDDVRQRGWWYFTTHGVQPGSIPKDLHVLEVRDGKNNNGTMGTFVRLDGILNTSELKEFDMKEMSPLDKSNKEESFSGYLELKDLKPISEDVRKEWKPNTNFKHIKDVLETALERGKYMNNEREEVMAALDLCDKKKYTPEQRKFIRDSHQEIWRKNRKTESVRRNKRTYIKESISYGDTTIEDYVENNFNGSKENKQKLIDFVGKKATGKDFFNGINMSIKDWESAGKKFGLSMKRHSVTEAKQWSTKYPQYQYEFDDGIKITASDETEAREKYNDIIENRYTGVRSKDDIDNLAQQLYDNGDAWAFNYFSDEELAILWALCSSVYSGGSGRAYDDEVYEAIYTQPEPQKIFKKAQRYYDKFNSGAELKLHEDKEDDDFETLKAAVKNMTNDFKNAEGDLSDFYMTWNFGYNDGGFVTGGIDVRMNDRNDLDKAEEVKKKVEAIFAKNGFELDKTFSKNPGKTLFGGIHYQIISKDRILSESLKEGAEGRKEPGFEFVILDMTDEKNPTVVAKRTTKVEAEWAALKMSGRAYGHKGVRKFDGKELDVQKVPIGEYKIGDTIDLDDYPYYNESLKEAYFEQDLSDIPLVDRLNFVNNKRNSMPNISSIKDFIGALNSVGLDEFKVRSSRFGRNLSDADLKDAWMDIHKNGWSVSRHIDNSLNGFKEVYLCKKIGTNESFNESKALNYAVEPHKIDMDLYDIVFCDWHPHAGERAHNKRFDSYEDALKFIKRNAKYNNWDVSPMNEDTIKTKDGKWTNKGDEGTHGKFKTKKEADAQRRAIWANWKK